MKMELIEVLSGILVIIILFIALWILPFSSTEQVYIGEFNQMLYFIDTYFKKNLLFKNCNGSI